MKWLNIRNTVALLLIACIPVYGALISGFDKLKLAADVDGNSKSITNLADIVLSDGSSFTGFVGTAATDVSAVSAALVATNAVLVSADTVISNQVVALAALTEYTADKNVTNGYAGLDENGFIESSTLPDIRIHFTGAHATE